MIRRGGTVRHVYPNGLNPALVIGEVKGTMLRRVVSGVAGHLPGGDEPPHSSIAVRCSRKSNSYWWYCGSMCAHSW